MRLPLAITIGFLLGIVAAAGRAEVRLARFTRAPAEIGASQAAMQRAALARELDEELERLRGAGRRATSLPDDPSEAVERLEGAIGDVGRRAILVLRGDTLVSWAGTLHADPRALTGRSGVVASPFGLTLYVAVDSGPVRAVATSLLYAAPPADRLTRGLAQRMPSDEITEGFAFAPPSETLTLDATRYMDGARPLFVARALVPSQGEVRFRLLERARVRVGLALLLAMIAFLVVVARRAAGAIAVAGGLLVVLRVISEVPLSDFSTRSRMFDAAVYFFPLGRTFTANAGALALTSAVLLLAVLLVVRRVGTRLPRWLAMAVAAITIGGGPFVVGALSRGITPPADGAGGALWLIWNLPLCLAATALLVLASWAGQIALGGRRGLPVGLGPMLALLAATVAPLVWRAPFQWPQWYSWLWIL
ncbi:MAG: histidine kinase region domain protein, partial [Gemmatimonadetes bacterium]|nr:histidine kinase region domain protein [Gemmatimonadota bacterium]